MENKMAIEYELIEVDVEKIIPDRNQPRQKYDLVGIIGLANSIESEGLINPLIVERLEGSEGMYKAVIGHRRLFGALIAGERKIFVKVVKGKLTDVQRLEMQIHEDSQENFLPWVRAENYHDFFQRLKEKNKDYAFGDFCRKIGKSEEMVRNGFRYASNLAPELKDAVVEGRLNYSIAVEIARINSPDPKKRDLVKKARDKQIILSNWILRQKKLSRTSLENMIDQANNEIAPKEFRMEAQKERKAIPKYIEHLRMQFYDASEFLNKVLQFSRIEADHREKMLNAEHEGKRLPDLLGILNDLGTKFSDKSLENSKLLDKLKERSKEKFRDVKDVDYIYKYAMEENVKKRGSKTERQGYKPVIEQVSLDLIKPDPKNPRGYFSKEGIKDLANSIKEVGLLNPILVTKINGTYRVVVGHRRYAAAKLAGLEKIDCFVRENLSEETIRTIQMIEDSQEEWRKEERAKAWSDYYDVLNKDEAKFNLESFSKKIGKSFGTVKKALAFEKLLLKKVKDMYSHDLISYSSATLLSEQEKERQYPLALEAAVNDYTTAMLSKKIKKEKENKNHCKLFHTNHEEIKERYLSEIGRKTATRVFYLNSSLEKVLEKKDTAIYKDRPAISRFFALKETAHSLNRFIKNLNN